MLLKEIKERAAKDFSILLRTYKNDERALKKNLDKMNEFLGKLEANTGGEFAKMNDQFKTYIECMIFEYELNKQWNDRIAEANRIDTLDLRTGGTLHH